MARRVRPKRRRSAPPAATHAVLRVDSLGADGDGVGLCEGRRIFIPLSAPGDLVECDIIGDRATILRWIETSPDRQSAPCRHYGACGGCSLQHVSRDYGAAWKRRRLSEELARAGLAAVSIADAELIAPATRRRATFAVSARDGWRIGFNAARSAEIAEIDGCLILHPTIKSKLGALSRLARLLAAPAFDLSVTLCRSGVDANAVGRNIREPEGRALAAIADAARDAGCIRLSINGSSVLQLEEPLVDFDGVFATPPPGGFLQPSSEGEAILRGLVRDAIGPSYRILDLFCGSGAFALPLARSAIVHAVDADGPAIAAIAAAAARAQRSGARLRSVTTERRDLFESPIEAGALAAYDAIIFDPPRAGAKAQAAEIAKCRAPAVVAVSCNPSTFARDAALLSQGGYLLARATLVDQFVYSPHIETVGVFRRAR